MDFACGFLRLSDLVHTSCNLGGAPPFIAALNLFIFTYQNNHDDNIITDVDIIFM